MGVSVLNDKLANENTPQELLMCVSPPPKRQKVKDKEFVIARRPRLLREAAPGKELEREKPFKISAVANL